MLDLAGIVTPEILEAKSEGRFGQFLKHSKPDYIVVVPTFRANALAFLKEPWVREAYRVVREFSSPGESEFYRIVERVER